MITVLFIYENGLDYDIYVVSYCPSQKAQG